MPRVGQNVPRVRQNVGQNVPRVGQNDIKSRTFTYQFSVHKAELLLATTIDNIVKCYV